MFLQELILSSERKRDQHASRWKTTCWKSCDITKSYQKPNGCQWDSYRSWAHHEINNNHCDMPRCWVKKKTPYKKKKFKKKKVTIKWLNIHTWCAHSPRTSSSDRSMLFWTLCFTSHVATISENSAVQCTLLQHVQLLTYHKW